MKARHEFNSDEEYAKYLRIYFTAKAMEGYLLSNPGYYQGDHGAPVPSEIAKASVEMADATLSELERDKQ